VALIVAIPKRFGQPHPDVVRQAIGLAPDLEAMTRANMLDLLADLVARDGFVVWRTLQLAQRFGLEHVTQEVEELR
jgi:hypothetical protein